MFGKGSTSPLLSKIANNEKRHTWVPFISATVGGACACPREHGDPLSALSDGELAESAAAAGVLSGGSGKFA